MTNPFDRDYFMDGIRTRKSNYENYRHLPEITEAACRSVVRYMGIKEGDSLLDFGAALGTYILGYRALGIIAFGYDISKWAVENCIPAAAPYLSNRMPLQQADWIVAKDVLEHVIYKDLRETIKFFLDGAKKGALICVPLTQEDGGSYILDVDNSDSTHVIRWPFAQWIEFLQGCVDDLGSPFVVSGGHRLPGLKEYGGLRHNGCGFFTLRRYP